MMLWVRNIPVDCEECNWIYERFYISNAGKDMKIWLIIHRSYIHTQKKFSRISCTYWLSKRAGRENISLEVRTRAFWPRDKYFPVRPDQQAFYHMTTIFFIFIFLVERGRGRQNCFVSCAFLKSQGFHAIHLASLWSVLQPQVVYKLKKIKYPDKIRKQTLSFLQMSSGFVTAETNCKKNKISAGELGRVPLSSLLSKSLSI